MHIAYTVNDQTFIFFHYDDFLFNDLQTGPAPMAPNTMVLPGYGAPVYTLPPAAQPYAATEPVPYGVAQTHPYPQRTPPEITEDDIKQVDIQSPFVFSSY